MVARPLKMHIRPATYSDLDSLMNLFEGAKAIMRASGNLQQWNNGYPTAEVVRNDISQGNCYVLCDGAEILGTIALIAGPDQTYSYIEGEWANEDPYYVIHRIATSAPGRNVAKTMFDWAFEHIGQHGYSVIRIDTHKDNCIMQHVLDKYGFTHCGVIYLDDGAPREAYLKDASVSGSREMESSTEIVVAPSDLSYAETITRFQVDMAMESEGFQLDYERTLKGVQAVLQDENKGRYVLAMIDERPVGSLMLTREWSDWNCCWYLWIQSVYVLPEHRSNGIFKSMYNKVLELATSEGISQVRLYVDKDNKKAQTVYQKLGMSECHYLMYEVEL